MAAARTGFIRSSEPAAEATALQAVEPSLSALFGLVPFVWHGTTLFTVSQQPLGLWASLELLLSRGELSLVAGLVIAPALGELFMSREDRPTLKALCGVGAIIIFGLAVNHYTSVTGMYLTKQVVSQHNVIYLSFWLYGCALVTGVLCIVTAGG